MSEVPVHPVQKSKLLPRERAFAPQTVTMKAYEVYKQLHGEQKALVTGECRGGFSNGELVAFLYAASFPRAVWRDRVNEAFRGMRL